MDKIKEYKDCELIVDLSHMPLDQAIEDELWEVMHEKMNALEEGEISNPSEARKVGHYWLRNPQLAPEDFRETIEKTINEIKIFAKKVHEGEILSEDGKLFANAIIIGIGGSSLGPRFLSEALSGKDNRIKLYFMDNTDPDGIEDIFAKVRQELSETLIIVISKSGGTVETRNGMLETKKQFDKRKLSFEKNFIAITQENSKLFNIAKEEKWLKTFPIWEWVGGRTSVFSAVGLLPLALQGCDLDSFIRGGMLCDKETRNNKDNPAKDITFAWLSSTSKKPSKNIVILPYKDKLELFSKYLQQLIMESLGKEYDLDGNVVNQGLYVMGNKGTSDQHSYLQQLMDGPGDYFVIFINALSFKAERSLIDGDYCSADYLQAFLLGTRKALSDKKKESITLSIKDVKEFNLGVLIALFERIVGYYAFALNINAYDQPAVEKSKKAAAEILEIKKEITSYLKKTKEMKSIKHIAQDLKLVNKQDIVYYLLEYLSANPESGIKNNSDHLPSERKYYFKI